MRVPALGSRGQGWVWIQFALMGVVVGFGFLPPGWPERLQLALSIAGGSVGLAGAAFAGWAGKTMGGALTPYPRPRGDALVENGPFASVRHPIYAGALLFFLGYGLFASPLALALVAPLALTWALKLRVEERFLRERHPGYEAYSRRVRWRLVPYVY